MKRYAIKVVKGKEFLQSHNEMIYLGDKTIEIHKKVINILNEKNPLKNLQDNYKYFLVNKNELCFSADYTMYKMIYQRNAIKLRRLS